MRQVDKLNGGGPLNRKKGRVKQGATKGGEGNEAYRGTGGGGDEAKKNQKTWCEGGFRSSMQSRQTKDS